MIPVTTSHIIPVPQTWLSPCAKRCPRGGGNFSLRTEVLHNHSEMSLSGVSRGSASLYVKLLQCFHEGKTAGFRRTQWSAHKPPSLRADQEPFHLQPCYYHHCGCVLSFLLIQPCTVHNSLYLNDLTWSSVLSSTIWGMDFMISSYR